METPARFVVDLLVPATVEAEKASGEPMGIDNPRSDRPVCNTLLDLQLVHSVEQLLRIPCLKLTIVLGVLRCGSSDLPFGSESQPSPPTVSLGSRHARCGVCREDPVDSYTPENRFYEAP